MVALTDRERTLIRDAEEWCTALKRVAGTAGGAVDGVVVEHADLIDVAHLLANLVATVKRLQKKVTD